MSKARQGLLPSSKESQPGGSVISPGSSNATITFGPTCCTTKMTEFYRHHPPTNHSNTASSTLASSYTSGWIVGCGWARTAGILAAILFSNTFSLLPEPLPAAALSSLTQSSLFDRVQTGPRPKRRPGGAIAHIDTTVTAAGANQNEERMKVRSR